MSNLSHTIRRFNRFELKYLITLQQAERFKQALQAYLIPDDHGDGSYKLSSLYYDSPDLRFFWEKMDGIKFRRKLHIRHYENGKPLSDDTLVFVEIKQRLDRVTQKRRVLLPYRDALLLCNQRERPGCDLQDIPAMDEIESILWQYNLRPVSMVRYLRQAFIGSDYDIGLRVTFDTALAYRTNHLQLHEKAVNLPLLPADRLVMEIKVNERIPYWLTELVAAHNLKLVRVSKYCRSIELAQNHTSARWLALAI
jgi:SPX domain protein involved in polyphosphate accumulation